MSDPRDIPAVGGLPPELAQLQGFIDATRESIQLREPSATSVGGELDKFVTRGELVASGLSFQGDSFAGVVDAGESGGTGTGGGGGGYVPDLTPPPTPSGLAVTPGIGFIIVECDVPFYTQGHGHDRTVVYGAKWPASDPTPPTFSEAVVLFEFQGTVGSYPSDPATRWCVWIKWQSVDGVQSVDPAGGINGVQATTGQDVAALLEALLGAITSAQLDSALLSTINLITAADTVPGSVAQRIAEVQEQVNALLEAPDYDNATAYAIGDVVKYLGGLYRATASTTGNLPTNTAFWQKIGDYDSLAGVVAAHGVTLDEHDVRITSTEDGIVAEAASRSALATQVRGSYTGTDVDALSAGLLYNERVARSTADSSIASSVTALSATVSGNAAAANAAILAEQTARASADSAETTARQALSATLTGLANPSGATLPSLSAGLIYDERTARTAADSALTTQVNSVSARLNTGGDIATAIANVTTTASAKNANFVQGTAPTATRLNDLWIDTSSGNVIRRWNGSAWVLADDQRIGATASQVTTLQSYVDSGVAEQLEAFTTWDFSATVDGWTATNAAITQPQTGLIRVAASTADPTLVSPAGLSISGQLYDRVRARVRRIAGAGWDGTVYYTTAGHGFASGFRKTIANPFLAPGSDWRVLEWDMSALTAGGTDWTTNTITRLRLDLGGNEADVFEVDWIAVGRRGTGVSVASFQQEITTRASQTGDLFAQYTVKIDLNGYVSGFGLASEAPVNGTPTSAFGIRADRFYVGAPGQPSVIPFVVQATPGTINGVPVPAGVYMDAAFILRGSIAGFHLGNGTIDDVKIVAVSASKLVAGSIAVGQYIQSTGYVAGSAGWRINGNGSAEFSNVTIRGATYTGTIFANSGTIGSCEINATDVRSVGFVAESTGWRLQSGGVFEAYASAGARRFNLSASGTTPLLQIPGLSILGNGSASFSGALAAATGSFAGALNAATGTFSGTMTADAVNAVSTINLANNAVSVVNAVSGTAETISTTLTVPAGQTMRVSAIVTVAGEEDRAASLDVSVTIDGNSRTERGTAFPFDPTYVNTLGVPWQLLRLPLTMQHQRNITGPATITVSASAYGSYPATYEGARNPVSPYVIQKRLVVLGFMK